MTELLAFEPDEDPDDSIPVVDEPVDLRPDLEALGIIEQERGVCEDNYENRQILRRAHLNWMPVYDQSGHPTGLIAARSKESLVERRIQSLSEKKPILTDPSNRNSDFLTGLDLLIEEKAASIVPPWVLGATRAWQQEQELGGPPTAKRAPKGLPHRCRIIKSDGIRCMLWASGRTKDDGLCRIHLKVQRKPGEDIERARRKIIQAAPYAVDILEDLMENAESEPVRLKATTEILDRAGIRGGTDLNIDIEVTETRPAAQVVAERLQRLAEGAVALTARLEAASRQTEIDVEIEDAELVETEETAEVISILEPGTEPALAVKNEFDDDLEEEARS